MPWSAHVFRKGSTLCCVRVFKGCSALIAASLILQPVIVSTAHAANAPKPIIVGQPDPTGDVAAYYADPANDPTLSNAELIKLLRQRVKYVFVLFQENRSFDHYFGTFRGANGLFSDGTNPRVPAANTQAIINTDGSVGSIQPFRIGNPENASDLDDVDHAPSAHGGEDAFGERRPGHGPLRAERAGEIPCRARRSTRRPRRPRFR